MVAILPGLVTTAQNSPAASLEKLNWLIGDWTRLQLKPGRSGSENWVMKSTTEWQGWGISMKGADTVFVEKLKILVRDSSLYYVADVAENKAPVYFKITLLGDKEFIAENPEHDFPKQIRYLREGDKLKATISGNGRSVDYFFERKQ